MIVLILNAGSSSIKYQLFDVDERKVLAKGIVDKIGMGDSALINYRIDGDEVKLEGVLNHGQEQLTFSIGEIQDPDFILDPNEVKTLESRAHPALVILGLYDKPRTEIIGQRIGEVTDPPGEHFEQTIFYQPNKAAIMLRVYCDKD